MLIGYARVSTSDQNNTLQVAALTTVGCECIYEEQASGAQRDRPQLKAALDYLRNGDTLVVWKLDRLARSLKQLIDTVEMLEGRGIALRSLTENIDTASPSGKLIFHVFGALAEFERSLIRERTQAGLAAARAMGRVGGRPRTMTPEKVDAARALLSGTEMTVSEVAKQIGVSTPTLYRYFPAAKWDSGNQIGPDSSPSHVVVPPIAITVIPTHGGHAIR